MVFEFPTSEQAPPEAYLLHGYQAFLFFIFYFLKLLANFINRWAHTDKSYCTYAFAFCPDVTIEPEAAFGGSSFTDIGLKVVVQQDTGTVLAFKPDHLHGTTLSHGAANSIIAITFSRRVSDAWAKVLERQGRPLISQEAVEH